ncbi:hypothetical protein FAM09_05530 [Niastella caeni]|uniref:Uncharacterized protein n=1 Tax=Niastella caeni TaxID=2569763 RepID=A0A4S8I2J5_9BACT|nr:hypothetical protein [Niastella caeni]THU41559.1 hypothetical protein FAM09_05530 [Niastella caeni]
MATNSKKSFMTYPYALIFLMGVLLIGSCKEEQPKDLICIPVPNDTSALGRKNHFIPVMSIDIYEKDFRATRDSLTRKFPELFIPNSETFNKASIVKFFENPKVVGLKFYYGVKPGDDKKKSLRLMIVGVDSAGNNVYIKNKKSALAAQASDEDGGLEYGQCTPPCDGFEPQEP